MSTSNMATEGGVASKISTWLGITSAVVTLTMTGFNAYLSNQINKIDSELKLSSADMERKKLNLSEEKDRIDRYKFVQGLFSQVLDGKDVGKKTLAVNLINLTLSESEATKLFTGMETSENKQTRELGKLGTDLVNINSLIMQMDAAIREDRLGAFDSLVKRYRADPNAVDQALGLLEPQKFDRLSSNGKINVLTFLVNTESPAWTPPLVTRANSAIALIQARHDSKTAEIGEKTRARLNELTMHLKASNK